MYMCIYLVFLLLFFGFFCKLLNELVNLLPSKVDEIYVSIRLNCCSFQVDKETSKFLIQ